MNATEHALADLAQFEAETLAVLDAIRAELETLPSYEGGKWKF